MLWGAPSSSRVGLSVPSCSDGIYVRFYQACAPFRSFISLMPCCARYMNVCSGAAERRASFLLAGVGVQPSQSPAVGARPSSGWCFIFRPVCRSLPLTRRI